MKHCLPLLLILVANLALANSEQEQAPLLDMQGDDGSTQEQALESSDDGFFAAARLGAVQSYKLTANSIAARLAADDNVVASGVGIRVGYDFRPWRTWLEYNPTVEATSDDVSLDIKSLSLATDYAVWQSSRQQVALGAYVRRIHANYRTVDVRGFSWGVNAAYRFYFTDFLYAGADLQYGLNGIKGKGDSSNNIGTIRVEDAMHANISVGFKF